MIADLDDLETPYLVGHRGSGVNIGEDPDRPIENTRESVRQAFQDGVKLVEVDVQITSDGVVVGFHDDFLGDFTCVNSLTLEELRARVGEVSRLKDILNTARSFRRRQEGPSGLLLVELKAPSPLCDPGDTTELAYVSAVIDVILDRDMGQQVLLQSFSPTLLELAASLAPGIERQLLGSVVQFLPSEVVEVVTGLPVTIIPKDDFGLEWAEIGPVFRLPGYESIEQFIEVSLMLGSRGVALDSLVLFQAEMSQPGSGAFLVGAMQMAGLTVMTYTLNTEAEWLFAESLGVDAIISDNIPLGLAEQG